MGHFLQLQIGLTIEIFGLDVGHLGLVTMLKQKHITGQVLVFVHPDDIAYHDVLPFGFGEPDLVKHLDLALVFAFVAHAPLPVLEEVFDHGDQHHDDQGEEHGGLALGDCDGWDHLQDADQQKVYYIRIQVLLEGFVNCSIRLKIGNEMRWYLEVEIWLLPIWASGRFDTIIRSCSYEYGVFFRNSFSQKDFYFTFEYFIRSYSFIYCVGWIIIPVLRSLMLSDVIIYKQSKCKSKIPQKYKLIVFLLTFLPRMRTYSSP